MLNVEVILVDVGNSSIKTTEVSNGEFSSTKKFPGYNELITHYSGFPMIVSSVRKLPSSIVGRSDTIILNNETPLPIKLDYKTPETLGPDRIAAVAGAHDLFPEENNLVVDLGTCMTIDLIDKTGIFRGGIISPGLKMRMKSMSHFTDQLPDISNEFDKVTSDVLGKSTKECLYSGSFWSIVHEINGVFRTLEQDFTSLNMILSGGDAHFFESKLKAHIFAGSKIVQKGLYRIWKYQQ